MDPILPHRPARPREPLRRVLLLAVTVLAAPALACSGTPDTGQHDAGQEVTGQEVGEPSGVATNGPVTSSTPPTAPSRTTSGAGGGLAWELPEGWSEVAPSNRMRMAQATIPGPGGPADLVLFHFGPGQGGDAAANIRRWIGQVEAEGEPEQGSFDSGDLTVSWVDVAGTLKPSQMGVGPSEPVPGSRLLGAVVEGSGGPWFFKATGPDETLAAAREDFLAMVRSARIE